MRPRRTDAVRGEVVREDVPVDRIEKTVVLEPASRLQSIAVVEFSDRGGAFSEGALAGEGIQQGHMRLHHRKAGEGAETEDGTWAK